MLPADLAQSGAQEWQEETTNAMVADNVVKHWEVA
jgi:hypothetical protein